MTFNVEFDERAFKEWNKLEKTIREQFIRAPKSDIRILQLHIMSWQFLKVRFLAKLRCPRVGYVSAFAKDFLAPCLELQQGFQHVVLIETSL